MLVLRGQRGQGHNTARCPSTRPCSSGEDPCPFTGSSRAPHPAPSPPQASLKERAAAPFGCPGQHPESLWFSPRPVRKPRLLPFQSQFRSPTLSSTPSPTLSPNTQITAEASRRAPGLNPCPPAVHSTDTAEASDGLAPWLRPGQLPRTLGTRAGRHRDLISPTHVSPSAQTNSLGLCSGGWETHTGRLAPAACLHSPTAHGGRPPHSIYLHPPAARPPPSCSLGHFSLMWACVCVFPCRDTNVGK